MDASVVHASYPRTLAIWNLNWRGSAYLAGFVAVTYFLVARGSLFLLEDGVAVFWPAAGIASGILIVLGPRARVPVVLGIAAATLAANLMADRNIWSTL